MPVTSPTTLATPVSGSDNTRELAKLFSKHFISRTDVFAMQRPDGTYKPVRRKITPQDLINHINGAHTYGHYLLDQDSKTKLFALDVDWNAAGFIPSIALPEQESDVAAWQASFSVRNLRAAWTNRRDPARTYLKIQLRTVLAQLERAARETLEVKTLACYSGAKGFHLYAPLGIPVAGSRALARVTAQEAREAAAITLETSGLFRQKSAGSNFWIAQEAGSIQKHGLPPGVLNFPEGALSAAALVSVEVYPKQDQLPEGDDSALGNLMRLPLGVNLKNPRDQSFFIDSALEYGALAPMDTSAVLENWR